MKHTNFTQKIAINAIHKAQIVAQTAAYLAAGKQIHRPTPDQNRYARKA